MCDIYGHPCKVCNKIIPMHLGGYETTNNEIEVFCSRHIPENDVTIWNCKDAFYSIVREDYLICGNPIRIGVRYLTENAVYNKDINHPNYCDVEIIEERT